MDTLYIEFAFIAFGLMGAQVPVQDALTHAESQLAAHYSAQALSAAKQAVASKVNHWEGYHA